LASNLILKEKVCDMLDYMRGRLKNFPREERSGITPRIRTAGYEMLEIAADIGNGFYTMTNMKAFDRKKNAMLAFMDYALRCGYLTPHQHKTWGAMLDEIGKINGGLTKALEAKQAANPRGRR
jgi:hypothetical protein